MSLESPKSLIENSKKSMFIIKSAWETKRGIEKKAEEQGYKIRIKYRDQIHDIEKLQRIEEEKYEALTKTKKDACDSVVNRNTVIASKLSKIVYLLDSFEKNDPFTPEKVKGRKSYNCTELCEILNSFDDGVLNVKLFLSECDRPKNKYVLSLLGFCKIGDHDWQSQSIRLPYDYGCDLSDWYCGANVRESIKYFPTIASAKAYADKHSIESLFGVFWGKYVKAKAEFIKVNEQYNIEDFKEVLISQCESYWTNNVSHSDSTLKDVGIKNHIWEKMSKSEKQKVIDWQRKGSKRLLI